MRRNAQLPRAGIDDRQPNEVSRQIERLYVQTDSRVLATASRPEFCAKRFYPHRTAGGDRHHRHFSGFVVAGAGEGKNEGSRHRVPQQHETTGALLGDVHHRLQ